MLVAYVSINALRGRYDQVISFSTIAWRIERNKGPILVYSAWNSGGQRACWVLSMGSPELDWQRGLAVAESCLTYLLTKVMLAGLQQDAGSSTNRSHNLESHSFILASWIYFAFHFTPALEIACPVVFLDSQIWNMPLLYAYATSKCRKNWHLMIGGLLLLLFSFFTRKYWKNKSETKIVIWIRWNWEKHRHIRTEVRILWKLFYIDFYI